MLDVFTHRQVILAADPSKMLAYFSTPRGLFRVFFYGPCSIFTMYVMPATVALVSPRGFGPYRIRLKRIFRPWMQVQPTICALLLFSTVAQIVMMALGLYETENLLFSLLSLILVPMPALATWSYSVLALSAGSSLKGWRAGWAAAIPRALVYALFWDLLSFILGNRGYLVL